MSSATCGVVRRTQGGASEGGWCLLWGETTGYGALAPHEGVATAYVRETPMAAPRP
jgi:hypothetical protein